MGSRGSEPGRDTREAKLRGAIKVDFALTRRVRKACL